MFPLFTWWTTLGVEAVRASEPCPAAPCAQAHATTDAVCRRHDRLLPFGSTPALEKRPLVEAAHVPLYVAYLLARYRGDRAPMVVVAVAAGALLVLVHLRRYPVARRVAAWSLLAAGAVAIRSIRNGVPSVRGALVAAFAVTTVLSAQFVRKTVRTRGALLEPPGSAALHLWTRPDGTPARSGAWATVLAFVGAVSLVVGSVAAIVSPHSLAGRRLPSLTVLALATAAVVVVVAADRRWRSELARLNPAWPPERDLPAWAQEPAGWAGLPPWPRALRRSTLRVVQSALGLWPFWRAPPTQRPAVGRGTRTLAGIASCAGHGLASLAVGLRRLVAPLFASLALVVVAGWCGLAVARGAERGSGTRTPVQALLLALAAVAVASLVVWLQANEPVGVVAGGTVRMLLVLGPNSLVRLTLLVVGAGLYDSIRLGRWVWPAPIAWAALALLVVLAVLSSLRPDET